MPANDKSTQDYFGHAIILSDTHIYVFDTLNWDTLGCQLQIERKVRLLKGNNAARQECQCHSECKSS